MNLQDATALPWMSQFKRNLRPKRIVWLQDDVTHNRFYWLTTDTPIQRERIVAERSGNIISILEGMKVDFVSDSMTGWLIWTNRSSSNVEMQSA